MSLCIFSWDIVTFRIEKICEDIIQIEYNLKSLDLGFGDKIIPQIQSCFCGVTFLLIWLFE